MGEDGLQTRAWRANRSRCGRARVSPLARELSRQRQGLACAFLRPTKFKAPLKWANRRRPLEPCTCRREGETGAFSAHSRGSRAATCGLQFAPEPRLGQQKMPIFLLLLLFLFLLLLLEADCARTMELTRDRRKDGQREKPFFGPVFAFAWLRARRASQNKSEPRRRTGLRLAASKSTSGICSAGQCAIFDVHSLRRDF